jgi:phosphohistidine phosphatase
MKTLLLIRHAKSSWANIGETDFDRSLNERGKREALEMAEKLVNQSIKIDAFVSSTAKRARKTCKVFLGAYGKNKEDIILVEKLYHPAPHIFYEVIKELNDDDDSVAIFSHNPGITEFVSTVCDKVRIVDMPTCGVFAVKVNINSWKDFEKTEKKFLFFKYPKEG